MMSNQTSTLCRETQLALTKLIGVHLGLLSTRELANVKRNLTSDGVHPLLYKVSGTMLPHGVAIAQLMYRSLSGVIATADNQSAIEVFLNTCSPTSYKLAPAAVVLDEWSCMNECLLCASRKASNLESFDEVEYLLLHKHLAQLDAKRKFVDMYLLKHATAKDVKQTKTTVEVKKKDPAPTGYYTTSRPDDLPPSSPSYNPISPEIPQCNLSDTESEDEEPPHKFARRERTVSDHRVPTSEPGPSYDPLKSSLASISSYSVKETINLDDEFDDPDSDDDKLNMCFE
jgi:hypothetical protein